MGKIIFQLLSFLYLYDSGIQVPVRIRKQSRYTGFRRLALTYRAAGIPTSDATGKFVQSRYIGVRRHREVCAKLVYRLLTSYGLKSCWVLKNMLSLYLKLFIDWNLTISTGRLFQQLMTLWLKLCNWISSLVRGLATFNVWPLLLVFPSNIKKLL